VWTGGESPQSPPQAALDGPFAVKANLVRSEWTGKPSLYVSKLEFTMPTQGASTNPISGFVRATLDQPFYTYTIQAPVSVSMKPWKVTTSLCTATARQALTRGWHPI
jgi:hypothetical protein